ncbi:uncharacterized protein PV09_02256 [Verruconis gallopava]|uniref:Uncharacterized protein n=1 Tax=Verruconis gallopava TaxID=253628 RepID=A0A0D2B868_9PEZI|nr:uncharacterized protein PV09_02256 [Verruconis gallopava]KIW07414.1 hypothetical protein PV09_02256 [Verruconis gallopava]
MHVVFLNSTNRICDTEILAKSSKMVELQHCGTLHDWSVEHSEKHLERLQSSESGSKDYGAHNLTCLWIGLASAVQANGQVQIGFAAHDGTYSIDFAVKTVGELQDGYSYPDGDHLSDNLAQEIENKCIDELRDFKQKHYYKIVGAGISTSLSVLCPRLPSLLWSELDIVPFVLERTTKSLNVMETIDEHADAVARRCVGFFGPTCQPRIQVGYRGEVEVDASYKAHLTTKEQYEKTVSSNTWRAAMHFASSLQQRNVKIAFFSATPQGGGVALMRHALVRFFRSIGVNCKWYVPKPSPEIFRITKTNHNILQGVADPDERFTEAQQRLIREWIEANSIQKWSPAGGPLSARADGGADIVIVDDPQMPDLVPIAKHMDPSRPVIFRSHIQIRSDLADQPGTPTSEVWQWLWDRVKHADIFISHPVRQFVPNGVDFQKVGWLPATTDWLDGLNKPLSEFDARHYIHEFNAASFRQHMRLLDYPNRNYIVQIARFDPSKGIPDVLASYAVLRRTYFKDVCTRDIPQLVLAGHSSVDDPDGSRIFDQTLQLLETKYADIADDVVLQRVGPADQILNALLSHAKVALQLSTREGFEVKVSEALHKGIPVIATNAGGIPLQVQHGKGGYIVEVGDHNAVAKYLNDLLTDADLYARMSRLAAESVSDEVGTVGNALAWMYLADSLTKGDDVKPGGAWINDLARKQAGVPYDKGENRLPRNLETLALTEKAYAVYN